MAVVLSEKLGSSMRTGHQTLARIQAAMDAGAEDKDFTCIHPEMDNSAE